MTTETQIKFTARIEITSQMIADQITTAIEGGVNYWLDSFRAQKGKELATEKPWYSDEKVWDSDFLIKAEVDDEVHDFTPDSIRKGLAWLSEHRIDVIQDIVVDVGDSQTADVFLQACLFGKIVYG